ncbi:MAG: hypothetical protein JO104_12075 [Candidatus Eremiobacteraeota bacterium]|nr:hypothetical protein [Candidatus Eremiobacteraeota bacterium]
MVLFNQFGAKFLGAAFVVALAGCGGRAAVIPPQAVSVEPSALANPDTNPPKCKGQKGTGKYAGVSKETMKAGGGSLCVPSFGGWGGSLQYPDSGMNYDVALTSSTTAYDPKLFPPPGSQKAVFYLQYAFNGFPSFGTTIPKGKPLASTHLKPKKPYTVEGFEKIGSGLWTDLGSCSAIAAKSHYGGGISGAGEVLAGQFFREETGVIEIFKGELVSNKC